MSPKKSINAPIADNAIYNHPTISNDFPIEFDEFDELKDSNESDEFKESDDFIFTCKLT